MKIEAFQTKEAFATLREEWNPLLQSSPRNRIFMTWEWQSTWWEAYHPGDLWIITLRNDEGQLIGIAPWFIDRNHPKGRLVRSVGCVEVTDYLELIIKPGCEYEVLRSLAHYTVVHHDLYDALDFCNIPADSPELTTWPHLLESAGYTVQITQQEVCPFIPLPETWDAYLEILDKKNRHELRRKLRRTGTVEIGWQYLNLNENIEAAEQRFVKLMRASSPDKAKFMDDPQNVDFFHRMLPMMAQKGWVQISLLQINGEDAAAYLSFDYGNKILLYNSGYNPNSALDMSPGIVLLAFIIRDAIEKGRSEFDFLRGNEEYKYRMGGQDRPVMMLNATLA